MPRVLVASARDWPNAPRLCRAFNDAGFEVGALAVAANPIHRLEAAHRKYVLNPNPRQSLKGLYDSIVKFEPDLIVACDDRILGSLRELHTKADPELRAVIERSLGRGAVDEGADLRRRLGELDGLAGVNVPPIEAIGSAGELRNWTRRHGLPAVLKVDNSTAGASVVVIRKQAELVRAFLQARLRSGAFRTLKRLFVDRDLGVLSRRRRPAINVQAYVAGIPANIAIACWKGEVIAHVAVEVLRSRGPYGIATVVRVVEGGAMLAAARSVCRRLELSGLHGLDFIIDDQRIPRLIEINMRATQTGHLALGAGRDLAAAFFAALTGEPATPRRSIINQPEIALFPQEWRRDRLSPFLSSAFHDLPREDPELARYYGFSVRPEPAPARPSFEFVA
jgi:hypothetical protein